MLYMKVACVGYPSAGGVNALITDTADASRNVAVITHRLIKSTIGTDLTVEKLLVRPQSLTIQHPNLRPMLITGKKYLSFLKRFVLFSLLTGNKYL